MTEIDGLDIHFIHVRSPHEDALPLIMTHGWPGSVIEMLEVIGPLTDPTAHGGRAEDAFDLVLPSLPGYGFSAEPTAVGWDPGRVAQAWAQLMNRLGYTRYVAQGATSAPPSPTPWGARRPRGCSASTSTCSWGAGHGRPTAGGIRGGTRGARRVRHIQDERLGYFLEQATRPQTIGYALLDSPVALAAWMLDHDTDSYQKISRAFLDGKPAGNLTRDRSSTTSPSTG